ncbi:MAG: uroporphyrinogen-III synthase [Thermoplasmata archaeon]
MYNILLFRPEEKNENININGVRIINIPLTKLVVDVGKEEIDKLKSESYQYIIFTSRFGYSTFKNFFSDSEFSNFINGKKIIAIGEKTAEGISNVTIPKKQTSEGIVEIIDKNKKILLVRSLDGNPDIIIKLLTKKADLKVLNLYHAKINDENSKKMYEEIKKTNIDAVIFTSSMIVNVFFKIFSKYEKPINLLPKLIISIGTPTAQTLLKYGVNSFSMGIPNVKKAIEKAMELLTIKDSKP